MKRDLIAGKYRTKLMWNMLRSGIIAYAVLILLFVFLYGVVTGMSMQGYDVRFFELSTENMYVYLVLFLLFGILIYTAVFACFQKKDVRYLAELAEAMDEISHGNLKQEIRVVGDDELAFMAEELNAMAEDIQNLMDRERESERSKNELVTNVAHDLRTPLTSIRGYLELLNRNPDLEREQRIKYTGIAFDKTKRLQDLIEELFGFTKMSYGKISVKPAKLDLVKLLEQLGDEFYPLFESAKLEYEFESTHRSVMLLGDGMLLARLFANLLNNAVKYGRDGKLIRVTAAYEAPLVTVRVINYGEVIPEDKLERLFEKFYRIENSRSGTTGGTGLGLAISKNIVELHGGQIAVRSSLEGTVFEVRLRTDHDFEKEDFIGVDDI